MKKIVYFILIFSIVLSANATPQKLITVNFDKISVQSVLKWFAKFNRQNVMVSSSVKGSVSLHLEKISWKNAFKALLISQGLADLKEGDVVYIAPIDEIANRKKQIASVGENLPLITKFIRLNYAKATNIAKLLKDKEQGVLSKQGRVLADARTNSLVLKDTPQQIKMINTLIKRLDVPVKQVAIEARIVNIDDDYEKEFGIKFGASVGRHLNGSFNVDLPATMSGAGQIGLALFRLAHGTLIDLELSALESEGRAEIISTPRVITSNQQSATIESGEDIPYQELASSQGATKTSFKKAVLRLKVTPQITPDKKVILHLQVNQDKRSSYEVQGVPAIDTRQINTQVLVSNGQTVVLGGIYERTRINGVDRVPFFSDLPGIGVLFRHRKVISNRRELLIFVTPTIVE